uniref:Anthocyanin 3'-O-beta-glucosyltransferase n=1 Tax=Cajanus cajan TaxID=3821 RepID=A0A151TFS4_CAJCA|nr:Anthocyanin 3'-O-beta-glucosyltransferase [Cajanus cajan]
MTRLQLPDWMRKPNPYGSLMKVVNDSTMRSFDAVFNSFHAFEGEYEEHGCGYDFIWVVKKNYNEEGDDVFMKDSGLLDIGWAPQLLILEPVAIGGMVSHCGWNTVVESMKVAIGVVKG